MRIRSLSAALLAGVLLVPVGASAASAAEPVVGMANTFKTSEVKRMKRAARTAAVQAPRTTAPVVAPPAVTAPVVTAPVPGPTTAVSYADRVLALTNLERTSRGLRALAFSSCADGFANSWAAALSRTGSLSHQPLSPIMTACSARGIGENVAYGNVGPEALVQMWMGSAGHRANILDATFTHLGVGAVSTAAGRVYGVQVFLTL